jgi:hypothetical protein
MGLSTFIHDLLPLKKKEEVINRKNVKLINEFLRERKKQKVARKDDLVHLKELRTNRSIDNDTYQRFKKVMILTHEKKRIELIDSVTRKSAELAGLQNGQKNNITGTGKENLEDVSGSGTMEIGQSGLTLTDDD